MRKTYIIIPAVLLLIIALNNNLQAQATVDMFNVESLSTESTNTGMFLTWESILADNGDYFIVEKLDKNWDYIEVGQVNYNALNAKSTYGFMDENPVDGENYYRITLVKEEGVRLISDLLIADHFIQQTKSDFKFLFNDKFANYAALNTIDLMPKQTGIFGTEKYAKNTLQLRRVKSTVSLNIAVTDIDSKSSMVAVLD